jgi:hypothetical protein
MKIYTTEHREYTSVTDEEMTQIIVSLRKDGFTLDKVETSPWHRTNGRVVGTKKTETTV